MAEVFENVFSVSGDTSLVVKGENGDVDVRAGPDDAIEVAATIDDPSKVDYRVQQEGNTITVEVKKKQRGLFGALRESDRTHISVTVPSRTAVDLGTINGNVDLEGTEGPAKLSTVNGRLFMVGVKGEFQGSTVNGGIKFSGDPAPGSSNSFATVNGSVDIVLEGTTRVEVDVSTVNGGVPTDLGVRSTTGDGRSAALDISTVNGSVTVE